MSLDTAAVTVATTATLLATGGGEGRGSITTITVKPAVGANGDLVLLGPAGVTTATGLPLGGGISFALAIGEALYGIVATGTVAVRVLEHG
jgi:hypothetical protein